MAFLNFTVKDATTIRDDFLRTIKNGLIRLGVSEPNVSPGSEWYVLGTALGNELAVVGANAVIKADAQMPDSATGEDLERLAAIFDLEKQPAAGSVGLIQITTSATSPVVTGSELIDANGLRYAVSIGGNYDNGDYIQIAAVDTGAATNKLEGDVLKWQVSPPYADERVTVGPGGLTNGIDDEDDEALRARVLARLQNPPGAGNWEHVAELGEKADARVQKTFVYPAVEGPASIRVVVTAAPTLTSKDRDLDSTVLSSIVAPYVAGSMPEHAYIDTTTVTNTSCDVAIGLSLPEAPTANPPGPGGGWTNGSPWPAPDGTTNFRVTVTAVTSTTEFTVDAQTEPVANVSRIAWLSPTDWTLYTALVTGFSGTAGAYVITIDTPFTGIATDNYIWPECQDGLLYCETLLAAFALMGPGELTSNANALIRGFRHPIGANGWPATAGPHLLNAMTSAHSESILAAQFFHRDAPSHTAVTGSTGILTPNVPAGTDDPPLQFVPRNLAFYRIP